MSFSLCLHLNGEPYNELLIVLSISYGLDLYTFLVRSARGSDLQLDCCLANCTLLPVQYTKPSWSFMSISKDSNIHLLPYILSAM